MTAITMHKVFRKGLGVLTHPHYHLLNAFSHRCNVCRKPTVFLCDDPSDRYIRRCLLCRSTPKYRAIAQALMEHSGKAYFEYLNGGAEIYEMSTTSPFFRISHGLANYKAGGYFPDKPFGIELKHGIWNQDCQALTFADNTHDLVISSETMEHVRKPWIGFREIRRILKLGGIHAFTIPFHPKHATVSRIDTSSDEDVDILPRQFHRDPYMKEGALVYTDFGNDLIERLKDCGFHTYEYLITNKQADIQDDLLPMRVFVSKSI